MNSSKKVAILGAGPMGLGVAFQLIKEGYQPVLFEADDRVGGMTACFDFGGIDIERYYHFHCTSDVDFFKVLKELNIDNQLIWINTKMGYWYNNQLQEWGNPFALLKFKGLSLIGKFRYGLHAFLSTKRNNWKSLEKIDARTWIQKWIGQEAYDVLWKNLFELKFYHYTENLSAPWIWSRIRRIGRSRENIFKEKLGYLKGGSNTLLYALKNYIEKNGGEVNLKSPIEKVIIENGAVKGLFIHGKRKDFNHVISTMPLPLFGKITPDLPDDILNKFKSKINIAVICIIVKLSKPLTENFWLNINDPEMDIPGIIEYSNLNPDVGHIAYIPYYMPRENFKFKDDDSVFKDKVHKYFKRINPDLRNEDILDIRVHRYAYAQPICQPNFMDTLPEERLPIEGLRAADTSFYYPEDRGISESLGYGRAMAKRAIQS